MTGLITCSSRYAIAARSDTALLSARAASARGSSARRTRRESARATLNARTSLCADSTADTAHERLQQKVGESVVRAVPALRVQFLSRSQQPASHARDGVWIDRSRLDDRKCQADIADQLETLEVIARCLRSGSPYPTRSLKPPHRYSSRTTRCNCDGLHLDDCARAAGRRSRSPISRDTCSPENRCSSASPPTRGSGRDGPCQTPHTAVRVTASASAEVAPLRILTFNKRITSSRLRSFPVRWRIVKSSR